MNGNLNVQPQYNVQGGDNQFEIFNYQNLGSVRTTRIETGEPLFCLVDVCNILGIKNSRRTMERLMVDGVHTMNVIDSMGRIQQATFVDQGNLFKIIFTSRKPEAQNFANWVSYEVLPSLMNKGYYTMQPMTEMEMINKMSGTIIEQQKVIDIHGERLDQHDMMFEMYSHQIEILSHEGYFTIATHARFRNIPISLETAQTLGTIATKICEERGIGVASIPHPTFNFIHAYPYEILNEVFSNYFSN